MSLKCKWQGHQWGQRDLVSITEVGSRGRREYFAFKRQCSNCGEFRFSEERQVVRGDHAVAETPVEQPIEIIRRDAQGLPYSSVTGQRVRFQGIEGV